MNELVEKFPDINGYSSDELKSINALSRGNKQELLKSQECGCFYCLRIFPTNQIQQWEISTWDKKEVGVCPFCFVDTLLGSQQMDISMKLLTAMNVRFFCPEKDPAIKEWMKKVLKNYPHKYPITLKRLKKALLSTLKDLFVRRRSAFFVSAIRILNSNEQIHATISGLPRLYWEDSCYLANHYAFTLNKKAAFAIIERNKDDLHQSYNQFCVIEQIWAGVTSDGTVNAWFFKWNKLDEKWEPTDLPVEIKGQWARRHTPESEQRIIRVGMDIFPFSC